MIAVTDSPGGTFDGKGYTRSDSLKRMPCACLPLLTTVTRSGRPATAWISDGEKRYSVAVIVTARTVSSAGFGC